ncbi:MAG TPA: FTR1 family protein [Thermoleophilaceae bacterium]
MTGSALILLREGLEGALIVAIVLAYLRKLDRRDGFRHVWAGTALAVGISVLVGAILFVTIGELQGDARKTVFAIIMLFAACVLTWMIFWMGRQARMLKGELQHKVDTALIAGAGGALVAVVFFAVLREGIETALFFVAAAGQSSTLDSLVGGSLGLAGALVLAYAFYRGARWLDLRLFFAVSGGLVLLFAAGLLARSVAQIQEVGALTTYWYPVFDASSVGLVSTDHFFGELLRGLFGWDPAPSIEELGVWLGYVVVVGTLYARSLRGMRKPRPTAAPAAAAAPQRQQPEIARAPEAADA